METVFIADADDTLGRVLCAELAAGGFQVVAHRREADGAHFPAPCITVTAGHLADALAIGRERAGPIRHVLFGQPSQGVTATPSDAGLDALVTVLEDELPRFLADLQAAGTMLARNSGGQIWVLTQDDSAHYYTRRPSVPIQARARHAAVKSFAKEIFRFGVRANCATLQLLAEQASPEEWRTARDGLKSFAMKFKPATVAAAARALRGFLEQDDLPIAGMVVPIGIGFSENNV